MVFASISWLSVPTFLPCRPFSYWINLHGDWWLLSTTERDSIQPVGVRCLFTSGSKKVPGKQWLWCNEKAEILIKWHCDWETWVWVFICRDWDLIHNVSISVVCSYPESQRRKRTQSCINTNLQPEHCAQERASRACHLTSISSYIPRQKTEFTYYGFSMSIPNT